MLESKKLDDLKISMENYLNNFTEQHIFSGSILVSIEGNKIIDKGYGMADYELDVPNTAGTKFRIGSITKQFTAMAIMQLVEEKRLNLDETLDRFISDYPNGNKVTIHHLLTHSSGIYNYTNDEDFLTYIRKYRTLEERIGKFKNKPFDFESGTKFSYSNSGYTLLGYIIEKAAGKSYEEYINENIFDKLSMNDSGYDNHISIIKNRAKGYDLVDKKIQNCEFIDMSIPYAAGALYSTTNDLYKWNLDLLNSTLVGKEYVQKMIDKQIKIEEDTYYGYGIYSNSEKINEKMRKDLSHWGGIPGFISANIIYPEEEVQVIVLTNLTNGTISEIVENLKKIIFDVL